MRLHRIGECPAQMVLVTFAETKVTRAKRGSSALKALDSRLRGNDEQKRSSRSFAALRMTKKQSHWVDQLRCYEALPPSRE